MAIYDQFMARFVILLLVIVALGGCAGTFRERIYQPSALGAEPEWPDGRAPLRMQVTTDDGIALDGLWWPPRSGQRDVIVYFTAMRATFIGIPHGQSPWRQTGAGCS